AVAGPYARSHCRGPGPVALFAFVQRDALALAHADVVGNGGHADHGAVGTEQRRGSHCDVDQAAILAPTPRIDVDAARRQWRRIGLRPGLSGRQQHVGVLADRLLVRVPEQAFRALVPTGDDAVEALTEDGLFGAFHDRRQMREPALGALALGEIADEG